MCNLWNRESHHDLTSQQAARTVVYLASSPEVDGVIGTYFANSKSKVSMSI